MTRKRKPEKEIAIFTPDEMERLLLAAHARILPLTAIGAFAGIRSAEIRRLDWEDIKWERGHIEIAGRKAKTAARRLTRLTDNLKAWLAPWRHESGPIITLADYSGALSDTAAKAEIPGGWRQNALRHSFISYRVAKTPDVLPAEGTNRDRATLNGWRGFPALARLLVGLNNKPTGGTSHFDWSS